ncbi:MAG: PAS domain S-box protein [Actinobacteria bacterium]|nr:PAS domain S-box protein [Actinomycetota bacterium]
MHNDKLARVLIVEDESDTTLLFKKLLERDFKLEIFTANDCASTRKSLKENNYDLVLLDYQLPDGDGLEILREINSADDPPPVIIVTGHGDEHVVVSSFKQGATGYVVKDKRLSTMLVAEVRNALTRAALREAEIKLKGLGEFYQILVENTSDVIFISNGEGKVKYISPSVEEVLGYKPSELEGKSAFEIVHPEDLPTLMTKFYDSEPGVPIRSLEHRVLHKDGTWKYFDAIGTNLLGNPAVAGNVIHSREITERKNVEKALRESKELYKTLMETSPDAVTVTDLHGKITNVSFRTLEMYGTENIDDLVGKNVFETISPRDRERARHFSKETYRQGFSRNVEYTLLRKDGTEYIVELNSTLLRDDEGDPKGFITIIRDITERKKTEEDLREREHLLRVITDNMLDIIIYFDYEGFVKYVSPSLETVLGYDLEESVGDNIMGMLEIVHPEDREHFQTSMEKGLATPTEQRIQYRMRNAEGNYVWLESIGNPLIGADSKFEGIVITIRDFSKRKEAEETLLKINAELNGYAHTVSHDLKSSVSAMLLGAETLKEILPQIEGDETRYKVKEIAETMSSSAERSCSLIENILSLAEAGQVPREISEVNVGRIVRQVLEEISGEIRKREVRVRMDPELGTINANSTQIYQLFSNIIINAVKHNSNPDPSLRISYSGKDEEGLHRYKIKDNGPGIPPGEFEKIFLPFYRGDSSTTGIGLATVDKIIQVYHGKVNVSNDDGACFEFGIKDMEQT